MRKCKNCWVTKTISCYYKHPLALEWYMTSCKDCKKEYQRSKQDNLYDQWRYENKPRKRLSAIFSWIKRRCSDENNKNYQRYGWRWIKCERLSFYHFCSDMQQSYIEYCEENYIPWKRTISIDRINNNGNYCKENCRRTDYKTQARNTTSTIIYKWKPLRDICDEMGLNWKKVYQRKNRWRSIKKALK